MLAVWGAAGSGLLLTSCGDAPRAADRPFTRLEAGAQRRWEEAAAAHLDPTPQLRARAEEAADRLAHGVEADSWQGLELEMRELAQAPAFSPQAASLPWIAWIEEGRRRKPELAAATLVAAEAVLGPAILPLLRSLDVRETSDALRLEAHRGLWLADPGEAAPRARALLFREEPRAQDRLRPAYLDSVLPLIPEADAAELLLQVAGHDGMEHRARLQAIRALRERRVDGAAPVLESIFIAERSNFVLRREAFQSLLELDPARGRELLQHHYPDEQADPGFRDWLQSLRDQEGVAPR